MDISLSQILNEIVEEVVEKDKPLVEGTDPTVEVPTEEAPKDDENTPEMASDESAEKESTPEDDELLAKLSSVFTPEEAEVLAQKLESGEISEEDILAHLETSDVNSAPVSESIQESFINPSMISALSSGAGALALRKQIRSSRER